MAPGFTKSPEVQRLLAPHTQDGAIRRMPAEILASLTALLPEGHKDDKHNNAPSIREILAFAADHPGVFVEGYVIYPPREDERISIDALYVPKQVESEAIERFGKPDELGQFKRLSFFWWD